MAQYFFDLLYNFTDCMCCFPSTPQLKINDRSFKLLRLLGEVCFVPLNQQLLQTDRMLTRRVMLRVVSPTYTWSRINPRPNCLR